MTKNLAKIELMAKIYKQIAEKINMEKPCPQDIEVELEMNLVIDKPRRMGFMVYEN